MLANAVSSAVERLYAAAPAVDDRGAVPRVTAVAAIPRLKPKAEGEGERDAEVREERDRVHSRHALTRGVLAVFEASTMGDTLGNEPASTRSDGADRPAAEANRPNPQLEEAILRFIHTVFSSLAETDASPAPGRSANAGIGNVVGTIDKSSLPAESREALSARIENLAQRLAQTGPSSDPATTSATPATAATAAPEVAVEDGRQPTAAPPNPQDAALQQAYAEVVQALQSKLGDGGRQSQTTRAELVSMMQRLALAMQGAPPIDPGLPTRGGLLSARA